WRWRPSARAVLRAPQHRRGFQGQSLHDRNLRGEAGAAVRLQGTAPGPGKGSRSGMASLSTDTRSDGVRRSSMGVLVVSGLVAGLLGASSFAQAPARVTAPAGA